MADGDAADHEIAQVEAVEVPNRDGLLSLAIGVTVVATLYLARDVLVPIMLAVLLSFVLAPIVSLLRRLRLPRILAVVITVLLALGVIGVLASIIGSQVAALGDNAPKYAASVEAKVARIRETTVGRLPSVIERLGKQFDRASGGAAPAPARRGTPVGTEARPMQVEMRPAPATPLGLIKSVLGPVVGPLETTLIVLIVAIFVLLQREDLRDRFIRVFGSHDLHRTTFAMNDAAARLGRYFLFQLGLNALFGTVITGGLFVIGVPSPVLWGILAGLLRFVPYIGSFLSALPPLVLAAAVAPDWGMAIAVALLFGVTEPVMGYVVEPLVYGHSTGLSPTAVIIAAIFWTWLWGPVGLVLSTPLTLCLVVLGRHFERLEFLDVLLGDRPALSPVETFYQRLLAAHGDDVLDQAEGILAERSLSSYYDEVAIPGLRLAAIDVDRGVLRDGRLVRVQKLTAGLLDDLADHPDAEQAKATPPETDMLADTPRPQRRKAKLPDAVAAPAVAGSVLCISGRGAMDFAAAAMLTQILAKHGIGARSIDFPGVSRERLAALDAGGIAMICVTGLEITGAPPYLRLLLRRLRARLPGVPVLVALAGDGGEGERETLGADHYAASLREAEVICQSVLAGGTADEARAVA